MFPHSFLESNDLFFMKRQTMSLLTGACKKNARGGIWARIGLPALETSNPSRFGGLWTDSRRFGSIPRLRFFNVSNRALSALLFENRTWKTRIWNQKIRNWDLGKSILDRELHPEDESLSQNAPRSPRLTWGSFPPVGELIPAPCLL